MREDLVFAVDEGHHLVERHAGHEVARSEHHVHHRAVGRSDDGRLFQVPAGVRELGARRLGLRLGDPHLRLRRGDLRLGARHRREVSLDPAGQLFPHLLLGRARRGDLRGQLVDVGLRLLQIEAVAGAGGGELRVLRDTLLRQFERGLQRGDLVRRLVELFAELAFSRFRIGQARLHVAQPGLFGPDLRLVRHQLRFERTNLDLVRRRIDPEQHVAFLHRPVVLDRYFDHPSLHLRRRWARRT